LDSNDEHDEAPPRNARTQDQKGEGASAHDAPHAPDLHEEGRAPRERTLKDAPEERAITHLSESKPQESKLHEHSRAPLDAEVNELLRFELNAALLSFIQAERPVVLEGFGIVSPTRRKTARTHLMGSWGVIREETVQTIVFEKCQDTSCLPADRYPRIVDTRELVQAVYSRLPITLQLRWSERDLRRLIVQFVRGVRDDLTENGFTEQLRALGHFYSIHNRQGNSIADWFAGSDIFIVPRQIRPLSLRSVRQFARPVLESSWELWEAAVGKPVWEGTSSVQRSLLELGFPENALEGQLVNPDEFKTALFIDANQANEGNENAHAIRGAHAVFVTDGLRSASRTSSHRNKLRHELVLRVPLRAIIGGQIDSGLAQTESTSQLENFSLPKDFVPQDWVAQVIAAGVLLAASERANPLRANAALALGRSLTGEKDCKLRSMFLVPCATFQSQQLAVDGPFHFASILGITSDEAKLLAAHGRDHLLAILESRGCANITVPDRPPTLLRTFVAPKRTASSI
jgi:hypothetical protein